MVFTGEPLCQLNFPIKTTRNTSHKEISSNARIKLRYFERWAVGPRSRKSHQALSYPVDLQDNSSLKLPTDVELLHMEYPRIIPALGGGYGQVPTRDEERKPGTVPRYRNGSAWHMATLTVQSAKRRRCKSNYYISAQRRKWLPLYWLKIWHNPFEILVRS